MSSSSSSESLAIFPAIAFVLVVCNLNEAVKDFFLDAFVLFVITTLSFYKFNKNIALAMAEGFLLTIFIKVITLQDPINGMTNTYEKFKLLLPGPDSKVSCNGMTKDELIKRYRGDMDQLRYEMEVRSVPANLFDITDQNAPVIATYLNLC